MPADPSLLKRPTRPRPGPAASPGRDPRQQPARRPAWANLTPAQILARYRPGQAAPHQVLEVLIELFNTQHTALAKTVSHKTRHERAQFLRRFFRDLKRKAGFKTVPDPRNLGQKHIQAMVEVWRRERLAPATLQTYFSFLRGLALWLGKPGFIRSPDYYGLAPADYQRHEDAQHDKGWAAHGVNIDALIAEVTAFDPYVGASLQLARTLGLRRKESVQFRPFAAVVAFEATGLPPEKQAAERYVIIKGKGGRVRAVPLDSPERQAAVAAAQALVGSRDAHLGHPARSLKQNLRRFDYVLARFGITFRERGVTGHGLRHEALIGHYAGQSGEAPPVRGGKPVPPERDRAARLAVSELAGHARLRAAGAYLGALRRRPPEAPDDSGVKHE